MFELIVFIIIRFSAAPVQYVSALPTVKDE